MSLLSLKYLHIISMVLLFGTGLGSAFYKWMADRTQNVQHIAMTNQHVVLADWLFTTPTILVQPITGFWMAYQLKLPLTTPWIVATLILYVLAGACWIPVLWLQIRMQALSNAALINHTQLPAMYWRYVRRWFWLGVPAFIAMMLIVLLMIFKRF